MAFCLKNCLLNAIKLALIVMIDHNNIETNRTFRLPFFRFLKVNPDD